MNTHGFHLLLDVWLHEEITDGLIAKIEDYIRMRFSVVAEVRKEFTPCGLTSILVLSESHFTIHSYPEHRYVSMDLYICSEDISLSRIQIEVLDLLKVKHYRASQHLRGVIDLSELRPLKLAATRAQ